MFKIKKKANCIRNAINFSKQNTYHKFDKKNFNENKFKNDIPIISPKLQELLDNIKRLDEEDYKKDNHYYKHIIYCDIKSSSAGIKMVCAGLIANDYNNIYNNKFEIQTSLFNKTNNIALLSSLTVYNKPFPVKLRKKIIEIFNERPANIFGDNIRFLLIDQGYKEGIDVFDVKYIHLFDDLLSNNDQKQAIGRGTRFCGQKGLNFEPNVGWVLHVYKYDLMINEQLEKKYNNNNAFELFIKESGIDLNKLFFANELENISRIGAVDNILTLSIHDKNFIKAKSSKISSSDSSSSKTKKSSIPIKEKTPEPIKEKSKSKNNIVHLDKTIFKSSSSSILRDIKYRIEYYKKIKKYVKNINKNQCLKYTGTTDGYNNYLITDKIKIIKQIGNKSSYGSIFLSIIEPSLSNSTELKFACKVMPVTIRNDDEIKICNKLTLEVLHNNNPNFPMIYKTFNCDIIENKKTYPEIIKNQKYYIMIMELAKGDLKDFLYTYYYDYELIINAIQQILLSILAFHYKINKLHNDCHYGNFLFHKIKAGGYFHYKVFNKDIYVKNLGYLWIIWDYGLVKNIVSYNDILKDYTRAIEAFIIRNNGGYLSNSVNIDKDATKFAILINTQVIAYFRRFNINTIEKLLFNSIVSTDLYLTHLPINETIINNTPYIIY